MSLGFPLSDNSIDKPKDEWQYSAAGPFGKQRRLIELIEVVRSKCVKDAGPGCRLMKDRNDLAQK